MDIKINLQKAMTELKNRNAVFEYVYNHSEETITLNGLKAVEGLLMQSENVVIGKLIEMPDQLYRKLSKYFTLLNGADIVVILYNNRAPKVILTYDNNLITTIFELENL